jgi:hypothetical protein
MRSKDQGSGIRDQGSGIKDQGSSNVITIIYIPYTKTPKNLKGIFENNNPPIEKKVVFFFRFLL